MNGFPSVICAVCNTAVKWHSAVNHISQVLGPRRDFAGYLTLCYTLVTPWQRWLKCFAADFKQNNDIEV